MPPYPPESVDEVPDGNELDSTQLEGTGPNIVIKRSFRIVIPCYDLEQMNRIAGKVSEFCSLDKEVLFSVEKDGKKLPGEVVMSRATVFCKDRVPVGG